jgi:SnoaL-like domain
VTILEPGSDKLPLRLAMEAKDVSAAVEAFAPDAVFRSPFTANFRFVGRDQIAVITAVVLDVFEDLHYTEERRIGDVAFLVSEARIRRERIEILDYIRLNADDLITEFTVFLRPLPGSAAALRVIGAALGRRKSRFRGAVISGLAAPLGLMTRTGDGIGVRLIKASL